MKSEKHNPKCNAVTLESLKDFRDGKPLHPCNMDCNKAEQNSRNHREGRNHYQ